MTESVRQDIHEVWDQLISDLPPNERAWLSSSRPVSLQDNHAIIAVSDDFGGWNRSAVSIFLHCRQ